MTNIGTLAGFDGWRKSSTRTGERGTKSEEGRFDPTTVIGLKSSDRVLFVGNPAFMPWVTDVVDVVSVRKVSDVKRLANSGAKYDKVIIGRERSLEWDEVVQLTHVLGAEHGPGTMVFFPKDTAEEERVSALVGYHYPISRSWKFNTTFGRSVVAELTGNSWHTYAEV